MIDNNEMVILYLNQTINNIFKVLPLFEKENIGLKSYIDSLLGGLYALEKVINIKHGYEYISVLECLEYVKNEIYTAESKHSVIKRELFKAIDIIKTMITMIEDGE